MPLAVKLDEHLSPLVGAPLIARGYEVRTVLGQGWCGLPDVELLTRVAAEGAFFITADKGFADLRAFAPGTHPGIVLLRPDRDSVIEYARLLDALLDQHAIPALASAVTVVSPRAIRIRRPAAQP